MLTNHYNDGTTSFCKEEIHLRRFVYGLQESTRHYTDGMSSREIAEVTGDRKTTVNEFLKRFRDCGEQSCPLLEEVANEFIDGIL